MNEIPIYKYIEIKSFDDEKVVKRMDVTGKGERMINKIEMGLNININHEKYYTFSFDSETKLKTI